MMKKNCHVKKKKKNNRADYPLASKWHARNERLKVFLHLLFLLFLLALGKLGFVNKDCGDNRQNNQNAVPMRNLVEVSLQNFNKSRRRRDIFAFALFKIALDVFAEVLECP